MLQLANVIYGDPPWIFKTYSHKGKGRSAEAHYDRLSTEAIMKLPVADLAAADCLLALWCTFPHVGQVGKWHSAARLIQGRASGVGRRTATLRGATNRSTDGR
jgi:hypothetical protein